MPVDKRVLRSRDVVRKYPKRRQVGVWDDGWGNVDYRVFVQVGIFSFREPGEVFEEGLVEIVIT